MKAKYLVMPALVIAMTIGCKKTETKTESTIPELTTVSPFLIASKTAMSGGNIIAEGGSLIVNKGICLSTTNQNPTTSDITYNEGRGAESFTTYIGNLLPDVTYYIRAYATNGVGTGYGNPLSFKTISATDIDGNKYLAVAIGNQIWMTENLKVTRLNDGSTISNITDNTAWGNTKSAGYCWYNNDMTTYKEFAPLYNWYAVSSGKLAPQGWHIPSSSDWGTLINYLGGSTGAGGDLKDGNSLHWTSYYNGGHSPCGFSAYGGGSRDNSGVFANNKVYGYWWYAGENDANTAWSLKVEGISPRAYFQANNKSYGLSVRCIKD